MTWSDISINFIIKRIKFIKYKNSAVKCKIFYPDADADFERKLSKRHFRSHNQLHANQKSGYVYLLSGKTSEEKYLLLSFYICLADLETSGIINN